MGESRIGKTSFSDTGPCVQLEVNIDSQTSFPAWVWFLPLEDPLDLLQGSIQMFTDPRPARDEGWTREDFPDQARPARSVISLKFWQIDASAQALEERTGLGFTAARLAFPDYFDEPSSNENWATEPMAVPVTVVEASCVRYEVDAPETLDIPRLMLEQAIERVQQVQRACSYVSGRTVRPLTLQTLPLSIPLATATVTAHGFVPNGGVNLYLLPANMRAIAVRSDFAEDDMDRVNSFVARAEGFLGGALASQSEARLALTFRGDTRASVLASATGCEILLDDLLRHLLWEDGRRPEDCVHIFYDRGQVTTTLKRALKYTQVLVKGDWNTAQQPDLKAWQHEIARVRNTVVHAGYRPTLEQAEVPQV